MEEFTVGTRIDHERYGEGIVSKVGFSDISVILVRGGETQFSKTNDELTILEPADNVGSGDSLTLAQVEEALTHVLEKHNGITNPVDMGGKWNDGVMLLQPGQEGLQSKEIPIETFFHKIVMVRDRLRVLEQNINSHDKLNDEDKVQLQQYISRCYGSLTTFNVLFAEKGDYFSSK